MTEFGKSPWIVTTSPHDNRSLGGGNLQLPIYPPKPVFSPAPANWPKADPVPGTPSAARALHALSVLNHDRKPTSTLHIPNAPGPAGTAAHHSSMWDLVLVIDTGASMTAWYPTIDSFVACTHELPLFATVHVLKLHSQGFDPNRNIFDRAALGTADLNAGRKKVIFLITDGVGPAWARPQIWQHIREWSESHPLAILHVQPHQNWPRATLHTHTLALRSSVPGGPNTTLEQKTPDPGSPAALLAAAPLQPGDVIIPVLELRKRWIDQWCRLLLSRQWVRQQALILRQSLPSKLPAPRAARDNRSEQAEKRVIDFLASASTETAQLAGYLAAAPLNRHIMQLIAGQLLPTAGPGDLSEILSSGLVRVADNVDPDDAPYNKVAFDFETGIRAALLAREGWEKSQAVAKLIEEYLTSTVPAVRGLAWRIEFRTPPDALIVNEDNLPFVTVERTVLQAMPLGPHSEAIRQMGSKIDAFRTGP
ncbi:SAV_2336 N-terminal domain-related protein [Streptomyces sp. NBC_00105]|uniref:SAV_2336 N-terminal domain-related protein n=1 Tax=Streptomyces sp. NBC_00105 TaxID=2903622 RepID=UPI003253FBA6